MAPDDYRHRAPAEFEIPWLPLGLSPASRRACILTGLALEAVAVAVAVHGYRRPGLAHLGAYVASGGLGLALLAAGWPVDDVFSTPAWAAARLQQDAAP